MGKVRWSYSAGEHGVNRVRVYNRPGHDTIHVAWTPVGRGKPVQRTLKRLAGRSLSIASEADKKLAQDIADKMAKGLRKLQEEVSEHRLFGAPPPRTLGELVKEYHAAHPEWSEAHRKGRERARDFWLSALGRGMKLSDITEALVEAKARDGAKKRKWGKRSRAKYLEYMRAVMNHAVRKLKWLPAGHALTALAMPKGRADTRHRTYSTEEVVKLLPATVETDLRLGAFAYMCATTGRRPKAIRWCRADGYRVETRGGKEVGVLPFVAEHDKASKHGEAVVADEARALVEMLLQRPAVKATGWLFPSGDLDGTRKRREPVSYEWLVENLHAAERAAGVEEVKDRAFYGFKRWAASVAEDRRALAEQAGVSEAMLASVYDQGDLDRKIAVALELSRKARGG